MSSARTLSAAAAAALSLTLSVPAVAAGLISDDVALINMRSGLSSAIAKATGDDDDRKHARAFARQLEEKLPIRAPDRATYARYPDDGGSAVQLFIIGVVPAQGLEQEDVFVCAEQGGRVRALLGVTKKGDVYPVHSWSGPRKAKTPNAFACDAFVTAKRDEMNERLASQRKPR
ncbi:hypothetical protein [Rhodocyclus tenuis]|uniref:DUF4410 domain-containing protein n=1 Tax=Rhodocyclus tenuis TaxID=1066 RepID=A0A840G7Z7_RHOTE|nr:hypothetical protein [Rhodocyclus tenuis]MBB4248463.1 hypothetical protein [Rhodocyclus tenuis]